MKRFWFLLLGAIVYAQSVEHIPIPGESQNMQHKLPLSAQKRSNLPILLESDDSSMPGYLMPAPAHELLKPSQIDRSNVGLDGVAPQNAAPLQLLPMQTQQGESGKIHFYLMSDVPPCMNCRNLSNRRLRLFLGRLTFVFRPVGLSFEPIKGSLAPSDVASEAYQLSFEYYDSLQQLNAFFEQQIAQVKSRLRHVALTNDDTLPAILRKLEAQFIFACEESGKKYWQNRWVIDREILFMSGIGAQKGGSVPHLSALIGACSLTPRAGELESEACAEWRKAVNEYPPLLSCSVLGNATNLAGEILEH
ncbi:MAG: hypothetical protein K2N54_01750 [Helicobacter sp.]|nr:hypothetical protein [Helicobacter sp.]